MASQFKNLVAPSGDCHRTNPLTGFASGFSGAVQRARVLGTEGISSASIQETTADASSIDAGEFASLIPHPVSHPSGSSFTTWGDAFAKDVQANVRAPLGFPLAPSLGPFHQQPLTYPTHVNQFLPQYLPTQEVNLNRESVVARESVNDDLAAAKRMVEVLRNSGNPKFANCTFVDFIDQVAQGDLKLKGGNVVDREGKVIDWEDVYGSSDDLATGGLGDLLEGTGDDAENLPDQMERIWNELRQDNEWLRDPTSADYRFHHSENPYIESSESPLEIALKLIREGRDSEAIIALEAEVRLNENSSEGWRLLGQLHAQFDRDIDAIQCLERGHSCDPLNLESILALGVSLTNELDSIKAMEILKKWIAGNEKYHELLNQLPMQEDPFGMPDFDFSRLKKHVMDLFLRASSIDPSDPEVAVALGVLHNIDRNYAQAIDAFLHAVELRPSDFTSWNKLGATMANAGLSKEALACYHQALALKPNYARAWSNLAIAHTNLEDYEAASKFFLAALQLSPEATHLWSSLVISLSNWQPDNTSFGEMLETKDLQGLVSAVSGTPRIESLPKPRVLTPDQAKSVVGNIRKVIGA
jgi:peroxin-5